MAHVFVGIGGTGNGVLKKLADKILKNEQLTSQLESKPEAVFWLIDCDRTPDISLPAVNTTLQVINPEKAQDYDYDNDIGFSKWFDPDFRTKGNINSKDAPGAGQIKMSGRYALSYGIEKLRKDRDSLLSQPGMEFEGAQVHLVSSLFGGTGAGMLYDIAYLLKERISQVTLYLLDPSFLQIADPGRKNAYSWNAAYASLTELDFWMSNNKGRPADQQFFMSYNNNTVNISDHRPPGFPVYLFCGTDQGGRSLAATGKKVHDTYQEFIANVLFERSFNYSFQQYYQTNFIKNFEVEAYSDESGHPRAFASFGLSYLRFPREKFHNYFVNHMVGKLFFPRYINGIQDAIELNTKASDFLSNKVRVSEKENKQITSMLAGLPTAKQLQNSYNNFLRVISKAKNNKDIPASQVGLDFNKLENEVRLVLDAIYEGKDVDLPGFKKTFSGYPNLIDDTILNMFDNGDHLPDIIGFVTNVKDLITKDKEHLNKYYLPLIDKYQKKNLAEETKKMHGVVKRTKTTLFSSKDFNRARNLYLEIFREYFDSEMINAWFSHVIDLLEKMEKDANRWVKTLKFIKRIIEDSIGGYESKASEALAKFKEGLFIYDKSLAEKNYLFELHIGDTKSILQSNMVRERIINPLERESKDILNQLWIGSQSYSGIKSMIQDVHKTSEIELNENITSFQKQWLSLFEKFVIIEIQNKVNSIGLSDVLNWQLDAIYHYVKNLKINQKANRKTFDEAIGKMNAMFGNEATSSLVNNIDQIKSVDWVERSKAALILYIRDMVHPLWRINESGKKKTMGKEWYYIFFPKNMNVSKDLRTGENEEETEWYDDRIVFLKALPGIRLNELDNLDDFKSIYFVEKKRKEKTSAAKSPPIFTDYRFYNEWEWDLDMDVSQQAHTKLLTYFAIGLLLKDNSKPLIERRKTKGGYSFWFNPSDGFKGKDSKKLGEGLAKSYENLNKDTSLSTHFIKRYTEAINKELYKVDDNDRFNAAKDLLSHTQKEWASLRPPEIKEGRTVKSGGNPVSRSYNYWSKTNDELTSIISRINNQNYTEYIY